MDLLGAHAEELISEGRKSGNDEDDTEEYGAVLRAGLQSLQRVRARPVVLHNAAVAPLLVVLRELEPRAGATKAQLRCLCGAPAGCCIRVTQLCRLPLMMVVSSVLTVACSCLRQRLNEEINVADVIGQDAYRRAVALSRRRAAFLQRSTSTDGNAIAVNGNGHHAAAAELQEAGMAKTVPKGS